MISFKSFTKIFLVSDLFRSKERKMPMELKNIHTFIKVAEFENFTKASNELGYAQSTVTMQIQQLENELQANLFERNGKRIRLSSAGQEFLKYAYQISKYESMALDHFHRTEEPEGASEHRDHGNRRVLGVQKSVFYLYGKVPEDHTSYRSCDHIEGHGRPRQRGIRSDFSLGQADRAC